MGSTSIESGGTSTTTPQPTPEEREMERIQLGQMKQYAPGQTQMFQNSFALGNQLLTSFQDPNSQQWQSLIGGITPTQQNSMVQQSLNSIMPQFQASGIINTGTAQSVAGQTAAGIYNQNAQFNVGTLQNALNLALGGQAQIQSPALSQSGQLGQQLAGLRSTTTTNSNYQTSNPFLNSFYSSMGKTLGSPSFGMGPFSFGG